MAVGAAVLPERPPRQTHPDSGERGSRNGSGKNGIGGGSRTDRDNNLRRRWQSPLLSLSSWGGDGRRDDDDGWQKRGARRRRGDNEATTRQRQGNKDAKAIRYGAAVGRGKEAIDKRITNTI